MIIFPNEDDFSDIHDLLAEAQDETKFDILAGIECDEDDRQTQMEQGDADPIAVLEIVLQWHEESHSGIVDWFFARMSTIEDEEPNIEHGGPLLAFRYVGDEPDYDALLKHAVPRLNHEIRWASFDTEELEEEEAE